MEKPVVLQLSSQSDNKVGVVFPSANKVGRGKALALTLLGLLCAFLLLDFSYLGFLFSGSTDEAAALTRSLHRRGYDKLSAVAQPNGRLLVRGVVDSNTRMDALVAYISGLSVKPDLTVASAEDLADALRARFKRADAALRVSRAGSVLRITGYIYDMLALEELMLPEKELLDLVPVRVDAITWNAAKNELRTLLISRGLEQKIRFLPGIYRVGLQSQPLAGPERQALTVFLRQADDFFGAEGALHVERWTNTPPPPIRPPAPAKILRLESTSSAALLVVPPTPANPPAEATPTPASTGHEPTLAPQAQEDPTSALPDALPQRFTCGSLRLVGEGHEMGVVLSGVVYRKGAKLPDDLQVKDVNPGYVVLQRGKVFAHICTAREMAKE